MYCHHYCYFSLCMLYICFIVFYMHVFSLFLLLCTYVRLYPFIIKKTIFQLILTATLEAGQIVFQTVTTDEITFAYGRDDEFTGTILYTATYSPADGTLDHNEAERTGSLAGLVPGTQYTVDCHYLKGGQRYYQQLRIYTDM